MSDIDYDLLASKITEKLQCSTDEYTCPLGLRVHEARAIGTVVRAAGWAGVIFAGAVLVAFASGFAWMIWQFVQFAIREIGSNPIK